MELFDLVSSIPWLAVLAGVIAVIALGLVIRATLRAECPFCKQRIGRKTKVCPYCNRDVIDPNRERE